MKPVAKRYSIGCHMMALALTAQRNLRTIQIVGSIKELGTVKKLAGKFDC